MKNLIAILILAVLAFSTVLFAAERRDVRKELQLKLAPIGDNAEVISALRARAGNVRTLSKAAIGFVAADTFHTAGTTYDYGWNGLTKQYIITDAMGFQHIAFHRRTNLNSGETRRVYYQFEIDDNALQVGVDVTPLGQGSGWPSIDVTSDGRAVINNHSGLVERLHVDQAPGFGLFASNPHPMDPSGNPLFPSLVVDQDIDRVYFWSTGAAYTAFGDSQVVYFTDNEGVSWDSTASVAWDYTGPGSYWSGSAIAISQDNSSIAVWQRYDAAPNMAGDTTDIIVYSRTNDGGATWTQTVPVWNNLAADGSADDIVTPFGYNDTLTIHPARGVDLTFDNTGNVHMVMNALAYHAINDSVAVNTTGILHYSSARGEGAANLIEISDQAISHAAFIDTAINIDGRWTGNGAGWNMPTIAAATDAPALLAMWIQWNGATGGDIASLHADTSAGGFYTSGIYAASSGDGGNTWSAPWQVASEGGAASLEFVTLDPVLETVDAAANLYRYNALWLEDYSPGVSLFGEGDSSMNVWVHAKEEITIIAIIGVEDEDVFSAKSFNLDQNYPNPFNPATRIDFTLDRKSKVNLTIFNMLGQEVATLVDEVTAAGNHNVTWNASDVASGVYFYKLTAGDLTLTKKMVLLK